MVNYKPYRDFAKVISNYSKKNDTQEQSESVLVKKKIPPKQNNQN